MAVLNRAKTGWFSALLVILLAAGCAARAADVAVQAPAGQEPANDLKRVVWWRVPSFSDDLSLESLIVACRASVDYYAAQPQGKTFRFGEDLFTAMEMRRFLETFLVFAAQHPDAGERRDYLKKNARIYRGGGHRKKTLFTGYYEPVLEGSRLPGVSYTVPVFGVPADLITVDLEAFDPGLKGRKLVGRYQGGRLVPYYTRHEIDRLDSLSGKGYEIAWVRDPVEAFFLQIQGSGKIFLPDGSVLNVHYAGNNGKPYRAIGAVLVEQGKISKEDVSMDTIKTYLNDHPEEAENIIDLNERYIFFREGPGGAKGGAGVLLTPERSLATDPACYPMGALAYIETETPVPAGGGKPVEWERARRFVLNQDAGAGVKGPGRADLYFGTGPLAGDRAGWMKRSGRVYFLAPKKEPPVREEVSDEKSPAPSKGKKN
jgi:membrane-bound lytic murein transglycosylase A